MRLGGCCGAKLNNNPAVFQAANIVDQYATFSRGGEKGLGIPLYVGKLPTDPEVLALLFLRNKEAVKRKEPLINHIVVSYI